MPSQESSAQSEENQRPGSCDEHDCWPREGDLKGMIADGVDSKSYDSGDEVFEDARDFLLDEFDWEVSPPSISRDPCSGADFHRSENGSRACDLKIRVDRRHTKPKHMVGKTSEARDRNGEKKLSMDLGQPVFQGNSHETGKGPGGGVKGDSKSDTEHSVLDFQNANGTRMRSPIVRKVEGGSKRKMETSEIDDTSDCDPSEISPKAEQSSTPNQDILQSRIKWMSSRVKTIVRFNLIRNALAARRAEVNHSEPHKEQAPEANGEPRMDTRHESSDDPNADYSSKQDVVPEDGKITISKEEDGQIDNTIEDGVHDGDKGSIDDLKATDNSIKVSTYRRSFKDFSDVRLIQRVVAHEGAIWTMKFSTCGSYLATSGQDLVVKVWKVGDLDIPAANDVQQQDSTAGRNEHYSRTRSKQDFFKNRTSSSSNSLDIKAVEDKPYRVWSGHRADILDLAWSQTGFLLSSSMDKTVRLWHISSTECLSAFTHPDFVTSIDFHPSNEKYFLSGSLDQKLRIWDIPERRVSDWTDVHEMITAAAFSSDGRRVVAGTYKGRCRFYAVENANLEYISQIEVKSRRGKNSKGRKVTGLQFHPGGSAQLVVTTNDSRIRVYNGYHLQCKYKGLRNSRLQIKATYSDDGNFIICGSEDKCAYIWSTTNSYVPLFYPLERGYKRDHNSSYEAFKVDDEIVTVAMFAPSQRRLARSSGSRVPSAQASPLSTHSFPIGDSVLSRNAANRLQQPSSRAEAREACESAYIGAYACGKVIFTASSDGVISIFGNHGLPQRL